MRRRKTDLKLATEALARNDLKALCDVLDRAANSKVMPVMKEVGDGTISDELWNDLAKYTAVRTAFDSAERHLKEAEKVLAKHGLQVP